MLKLWKNLRYKLGAIFLLTAIINFIGTKLEIKALTGIVAYVVNALILYVLFMFVVGVRNLWVVDDDKVNAIIFGVVGTVFFGALIYFFFIQ